jgi:hypothetical protein
MILKMIAAIFLILSFSEAAASEPEIQIIDSSTGLTMYKYGITSPSDSSKNDLYVLKIDPDQYEFRFLAAIDIDSVSRTASRWCSEFGYELCFNAGMYAADNLTPLGYSKNNGRILNPRINYHKAVLAFNPADDSLAPLRVINRGCEELDSFENKYNSMVQSVRMLGCAGGNVWNQSDEKHSILAMATDNSGMVFLLFSQAPISGYDFINNIKALKLGIQQMIYLEGGVPASLYIKTNNYSFDISGVAVELWPLRISGSGFAKLPNVIAVRKKADRR